MPLFKRSLKRTRSRSSKTYAKPPPSRRNVNVKEGKYVTFAEQSQTCGASGVVSHLDLVAQGTSAEDRLGQKWLVSGVHIKGSITIDGDSSTRDQAGYQLVWDSQPNTALPSASDILSVPGSSAFAFPNEDNQDRFTFLSKNSWVLTKNEATSGVGYNMNSQIKIDQNHMFRRKLQATTTLDGTAGLIATRTTGALYLLTTGTGNGDNLSTMNFSYRLFFTDV